MYETTFIADQRALLFFTYGLIFFSIGISILNQPRREKSTSSSPEFWLLGAFGILHGASEWLIMVQFIEGDAARWEVWRVGVAALSFLSLFEFGRRLMSDAAGGVHSPMAFIARPYIAYLLPASGGILLALYEPGLAEVETSIRYTVGFPGAVLAGTGFLHYARVGEIAVNDPFVRAGLRMAGIAFLAYSVAAGVVVPPSGIPCSHVINQAEFRNLFGIPIEVVRIFIGGFLLAGMARLNQSFNALAFNRLLEARGEAHSLRQQSELILNLVDDAIWGVDEDGNISFVNTAAKRMLGYDDGDDALLGLPSAKLRSCDPCSEHPGNGQSPCCCPPFPHPEHYRSELEYLVRRDGALLPVEYTSAPKYKGPRLTGAVVVFRDISERRQHEVAARWEQEERFGALFEQAAVGMAVVALDGRCLQVNMRLATMLGNPKQAMVGSSLWDFIHADERERCATLKGLLLGGDARASTPLECRFLRHDGSIVWVQFSCAIVRDCADKPMYCFLAVEDISERKQAERIRENYQATLEQQVQERTHALARSNHELESANRELEAFSYSVSHDLRSPLRAINGFTHALEEDYGAVLGDSGLEYIRRTQNATVRMSDLIDSLLNLSRVFRSELAVTRVNLSQLAAELTEQLQQSYRDRQVTVYIELGLEARGDATLLRLLVQNLLDNAWKFTEGCEEASVTFGQTVWAGKQAYFVSDNGVGFESEYAHKLFQPFERLHGEAEYEGIGIGLATVRRIVQRHNGAAWANGEVSNGATFYFTLAAEAA